MNGRWAYFKWQYPIVRRLFADADRARDIQQQVLREKISLAADSRFGRDHGLASIRSSEDFRRQVPIADFEYFRPYVDEARAGNPGALFGPKTRLLMFALTSASL